MGSRVKRSHVKIAKVLTVLQKAINQKIHPAKTLRIREHNHSHLLVIRQTQIRVDILPAVEKFTFCRAVYFAGKISSSGGRGPGVCANDASFANVRLK